LVSLGLIAVSVFGFAGWSLHRWRRPVSPAIPRTAPNAVPAKPADATSQAVPSSLDPLLLQSTNAELSGRLWRLAYAAPAHSEPLEPVHAQVRVAIVAKLQPETLNPDYFPRRPTLMQQLLRAVDDPDAEADKLSRMIAHDPVISADVLRIANSSLYRTSPEPIESIQRAIVICGVDSLRGILATAMVRPVFRATRTNFPRLPRLLWDRTERAARAAELYAMAATPQDRFEAQLAVLLSALGPLVVYSAALDVYARRPRLTPSPALLVELTLTLGADMSRRIAQEWGSSPRLIEALERKAGGSLSMALSVGELLGTAMVLESHAALTGDERIASVESAGLTLATVEGIWEKMGLR
jgi:HD-like signal output (HDOD) protein